MQLDCWISFFKCTYHDLRGAVYTYIYIHGRLICTICKSIYRYTYSFNIERYIYVYVYVYIYISSIHIHRCFRWISEASVGHCSFQKGPKKLLLTAFWCLCWGIKQLEFCMNIFNLLGNVRPVGFRVHEWLVVRNVPNRNHFWFQKIECHDE